MTDSHLPSISLSRSIRDAIAILPTRLRRSWAGLTALLGVAALTEVFTAAAVFGLIAVIGGTVPAFAAGPLRVLTRAGLDPAEAMLAAAVVVLLFKNAILILASARQARVTSESIAAGFVRLAGGFITAPLELHLRTSDAQLNQAVLSADIAYRVFLSSAVALVTETIVAVCLAATLLALMPLPTLAVIAVVGGGMSLTLHGMARSVRRWGAQTYQAEREMLHSMQEIAGGIREIKSGQREVPFLARAVAANRNFVEGVRRQLALLPLPRVINEIIFIVVAVSLFLFLKKGAMSAERVVAFLAVFAYAGFRSIPSANRIAFSLNQLRHSQPGVTQLADLLKQLHHTETLPREQRAFVFRDAIELRGIAFGYEGNPSFALSDISMTIRKGELVGILGANGSGKSTLLDIMAGMMEPAGGTIAIDGRPLSEWLSFGPPLFGYVPQRAFLLDGPLVENIALGLPEAQIDVHALERAMRAAYVESLTGIQLSGGQRQRTAIARALYDDPEILLLDEATSALDPAAEALVMESIESLRGKKTIVMVTQDLAAARNCDRIVLLDEGRIVADGTFDELQASSLAFHRLAHLEASKREIAQ